MAVVSGRLQIRNWQDKEGNKRRSAEVVADNVYFGESKRDSMGFVRFRPDAAARLVSGPANPPPRLISHADGATIPTFRSELAFHKTKIGGFLWQG